MTSTNLESKALPRILILGARGFLGLTLLEWANVEKYQIIASARDQSNIPSKFEFLPIDITKREQTIDSIATLEPDIVINCVAISLPDFAEDHTEMTEAVNVEGVQNIVEACNATGAQLIHLSTDYVFAGEKGNYKEESERHPVNFYGKTKVAGEDIVIKSSNSYVICRTAVLYGIPKSFQRPEIFMGYFQTLQAGKKVQTTTQIANVTMVDNLAQALYKIVDYLLLHPNCREVLHTAGRESITRTLFAKKIATIFNFNLDLIEEIEPPPKRAQRPRNSGLVVKKMSEMLGIEFPPLVENLRYLKEKIKSKNSLNI